MRKSIVTLLSWLLVVATSPALAQMPRQPLLNTPSPVVNGADTRAKTPAPANTGTRTAQQGDLSSLAASGSVEAGSAYVEPKTVVVKEAVASSIPVLTAAQLRARAEMEAEYEDLPLKEGPPAPAGFIVPPTEAATVAMAHSTVEAPQAPNDMTYFLSHNITATEVSTSQRSAIQEPSVVNLNTGVFFTANWYAAKSADSGNTFTYINPYTFFPSINGGFCCDQVTAYAPSQDMVLWGLQYVKDTTSGTLRIARTIGSSGVASNAWAYYDFNPQQVGFATGTWFDYPSMTVGANFLYVTSNVFRTADDVGVGSVVMRLPLSNIAAGTGFNFSYVTFTSTLRCAEGATTTMYCAGFSNTTQMRIYSWDESSTSAAFNDVNLNAFTPLSRNGVATGPDGTNWAARADGRPTAAYRAGGVIGVMFMARQDANFPYPYTIHARFNESTRALVSQAPIWNPNYAWLYPSAAPNAAGNLAGTLQLGGGTAANGFPYPGTQVWITDDVQPSTTTVGGVYLLSNGTAGPSNNSWGDFFTVRPHKTFPNTWVSASFSLSGGQTGSSTIPNYTWFGRQRDGAPSSCTYGISPTNNTFGAGGGTGSVTVTTQSGCTWSAISNDPSWITVTSGSSGSGNGTVGYSVAAYTGTSNRTNTITIAGQTFTITQNGTGSSTGLRFFLLSTPIRLLDTRAGELACTTPGVPITAGTSLTLPARTTCTGIPAGALAIVGNIAVVNIVTGSGGGFLTLYPSNVTRPLAANINYTPGAVLNNFFTVGLGTDGAFKIYAATTTHVVVDVTGYYAP